LLDFLLFDSVCDEPLPFHGPIESILNLAMTDNVAAVATIVCRLTIAVRENIRRDYQIPIKLIFAYSGIQLAPHVVNSPAI